jgi:hypothetical protein
MTCVTASAGEEVIKDSQGMDCFVYTPDPMDAAKIYQLVVGVHGARGNGKGAAMKSPPTGCSRSCVNHGGNCESESLVK